MYRSARITDFINKVNEEAENAAQKVYDSHKDEFERLVKSEMKAGQTIHVLNGAAVFGGRRNESDAMVRFADAVAYIQYTRQGAGFNFSEISNP